VRTLSSSSGTRLLLKLLAAVAVVVLSVLFLWPVLMLVLGAFRTGAPGGPGEWTFAAFLEALSDPETWLVSLNSIILAVVTSGLGILIGTFLAWVAVRTTSPLRRIMTPVMAVILFLPALFYGLGWVLMTSGHNAPLNVFTRTVLGIEEPLFGPSWPTMLILVTAFVIPVGYLFMVGPMSRLDAGMDDAARISGANKSKTLFTITVPLLRPAMLGVFVLLTSYAFSAFELPLLFGLPDHIQVFSTAVFTMMTGSVVTPNYAGASTLSIILMVLVASLVLLKMLATRRRTYATISGKGFRPEPKDYGRIQYLFTAIFVLVVIVSGIIPLGEMVLGSFQPLFGVPGSLTLDNYRTVLADSVSMSSIGLTVILAVVGGFFSTSIALLLAYVASKHSAWVKSFAAFVSWSPLAIPGVVVGLALISAYPPIPGLRMLFGTVWLLLIGFIVIVIPIGSRAVEGGLVQISTELEDAARVSGASAARTFSSIVVRLVMPSFLAGWFLSGLIIAGNLSLPVLLSSPTLQPTAVRAYSLYTQGNTAQAAALFLLLLVTILLLAAVCYALYRGVRTTRRRVLRSNQPTM
jgi:iron(III) transport system permease protein